MDEENPKDEDLNIETLEKPREETNEEREAKTEERREEGREKRKHYLSIIIILILFVTGFNLGKSIKFNKEKDEVASGPKKVGYEDRLQRLSNTEAAYGNTVGLNEEEKENENTTDRYNTKEAEVLTFAKYEIKNETEATKGCSITPGVERNFSIYLSEDAFVYGSYNVEGKTLICHAETFRDNDEEVFTINTTITFQIVDKQTLRVAGVEFGDIEDEEFKDSELISLNGLKNGTEYVCKFKVD